MAYRIPRLVIGAVSSGCGKTTIVTGLLSALRQQEVRVQSYKIGPDYIDPGYHRLASGRPAYNMDTWLVSGETMVNAFIDTASQSDFALIEGVMGLYDGGNGGISSTAEIARMLDAPVVLVIDCKSMGASAAAIALGFKLYDARVRLAGVILNRIGSDNHQKMIEDALAQLQIPVLGAVRRDEALVMPERHLGLLPVEENEAGRVVDAMGEAMARQINFAALMQVAHSAPALQKVADKKDAYLSQVIEGRKRSFPDDFGRIRIALARDEAFSFYYPESLATLERLGARIVEFSPLQDRELPEADGLLLGGGFPEMFAEKLSGNREMLQAIRRAAEDGMPVFAECGGYMYLSDSLTDFEGREYPMCGVLPGRVRMNKRLQMVGYVEAELQRDCCLGQAGMKLKGHEFHFSSEMAGEADVTGERAFQFTRMRNGAVYPGGFVSSRGNVAGSYLHIHFAGCPEAAVAFVGNCWNYRIRCQGRV
ncbi:cobyrinate a,c-diamide synthase [Anaerovibrio sp.]|uniref:cobyrinate a,c-diamide synthase n=1 Tax=Anaerovibrio sp. TaxID=1872532 RepID=UPI003F173E9B